MPDTHAPWMQRALDLSCLGLGWVNPNPTVGAVLVKDQQIIGEGFHRKVGMPHAEIEAFADATRKGHTIAGATLYVTLEPCCHSGRTPPCVDAIIREKIARVVVAELDPNPKVNGKGLQRLREAGIAVEVGLLAEQAGEQNQIYRHWITQPRSKPKPYVALKMSVSLDGKISPAQKKKHTVFYLIGPEAQHEVHRMRQAYDAILVGINTLLQDNPQLTTRLNDVASLRHPMPVILDRNARTPLDSRVLRPLLGRRPAVIVVGLNAPKKKCRDLERKGAWIVPVGEKKGGLSLDAVLQALGKAGVTSLMVEGGGQVARSFLECQLVNQVDWVMAPCVLGPNAVPAIAGDVRLKETFAPIRIKNLGKDVWITWKCC